MPAAKSTSPLLELPVELRYDMYDLLCITEPKSYPFGFSPITFIDRRPPSVALQLTCKLIHHELEDLFYRQATLRMHIQSWQPHYKRDRDTWLKPIRLARKIEVVLNWRPCGLDPAENRSDLNDDLDGTTVAAERQSLASTVKLLNAEATKLEVLTITVRDLCSFEKGCAVGWISLDPLENVSPHVRVVLGEADFDSGGFEDLYGGWKEYLGRMNARRMKT
ncbi:hypothetical protein EK21DRAFT_110400 [Setomelanomma holmii]|uniref:Uncharacterized protein n=1 Tax=Setomelanomma holmii TaxID=210430 RepID=A0A9P4LPP9_9PLEO|nr:hypothetical protein EK21DRAFT_110400 [Setomelanomma holmii]